MKNQDPNIAAIVHLQERVTRLENLIDAVLPRLDWATTKIRELDDLLYEKRHERLEKDMDDRICAWHRSNSPLELHEFLGMTQQEYFRYVSDSSKFFDEKLRRENR